MEEPPHCNSLHRKSFTPWSGTAGTTAPRDSSIHILGSCWGIAFLLLASYSLLFNASDDANDAESLSQTHYLRAAQRSLKTEAVVAFSNSSCNESCCASAFPCSSSSSSSSSNGWIDAIPLPAQILLIILLICSSAMFAGLTLGLLSLDKTGLEIVMSGDDLRNARFAQRIYPIRKNGNLLLCTLLLGNVSVNALLSILLADKTGGIVGFFASTFLILIFGEIIPQATCSRYPLLIGSQVVPVVRVFIVLFYPITAPLAFILNKALGREVATTYNQSEMLKLLQIHVQEQVLDKETAGAMEGALKYKVRWFLLLFLCAGLEPVQWRMF